MKNEKMLLYKKIMVTVVSSVTRRVNRSNVEREVEKLRNTHG